MSQPGQTTPPGATASTPPANQPPGTEVVNDIPVKSPYDAHQAGELPKTPAPKTEGSGDKELDFILKSVNSDVKNNRPAELPQSPLGTANSKNAKKSTAGNPKLPAVKRLLPIIAAFVVAIGLSATAVYALSQPQKRQSLSSEDSRKVGTSSNAGDAIQAAGGTLVTPGSIENFIQTLNSDLNGLNDTQDFDENSLKDSTLGL